MRHLAIAVAALMIGPPGAMAQHHHGSQEGQKQRGPEMCQGRCGHGPGHGEGRGFGHGAGRGARHGAGHGAVQDAEQRAQAVGGHERGMSDVEHGNIQALLSAHQSIRRTVEEIEGGVKTTTVTDRPELVASLQEHVRQMSKRLETGRQVRVWDPLFREIFAHADEISLTWTDLENGIEVVETSENPDVVPLIRAHAKKVNRFVAEGHTAARPPWAGGRGRGQRP